MTIPGIDGSDDEHWQSIWEAEWGRRASRISVSSWALPELECPLEVAGLIVSSDNDPYCSAEVAGRLAHAWALPRVSAGPAGHVNSASGLGRRDTGYALVTAFTAGLRAARASRQAQPDQRGL
ncbi:MAG: alpha/beta hydrolase [Trebonia sp.]